MGPSFDQKSDEASSFCMFGDSQKSAENVQPLGLSGNNCFFFVRQLAQFSRAPYIEPIFERDLPNLSSRAE